MANTQVNLQDVTKGLSKDTQIPHAEILLNFAEAIVKRDIAIISNTRNIVFETLGNDITVDAAAVASAFHGFVRIADTIGIPYDTAAQGQDVPEIRETTGINNFYRIQEAN